MVDLINETLNDSFSDFKKYQLLIMGITILIVLTLQIIQTVYVSKAIEKFKTTLKKSEIKFSKYNTLQLEALRSFYIKLVYFHGANEDLLDSEYESNDHNRYKERILNWLNNYSKCSNEFSKEKILFPIHLKDISIKTLDSFKKVYKILVHEKKYLEFLEMDSNYNWSKMYEIPDNELFEINKKIEKLKSQDEISKSDENIRELRKAIEDYFETMNS